MEIKDKNGRVLKLGDIVYDWGHDDCVLIGGGSFSTVEGVDCFYDDGETFEDWEFFMTAEEVRKTLERPLENPIVPA